MPSSSPCRFTSAPPELPWLIGASVCRKSWKLPSPVPVVRPLALMMPEVTVWPDAERVADGQHHVAHARLVRIGERHRAQPGGLHLQHRQVARRVVANDRRGQHAAIRQLHFDAIGAVHHMVVGQDVAVGVDDDAGAKPFLARRAHAAAEAALVELAAEELTETGIGKRQRRGRGLRLLGRRGR